MSCVQLFVRRPHWLPGRFGLTSRTNRHRWPTRVDTFNKLETAHKHMEIIPGAGHNDLMPLY